MNDQEAYEFYSKPENLAPAGPGRRLRLKEVLSVRVSGPTMTALRRAARNDGRSVGAWVRKVLQAELVRQVRPAYLIPGSGRRGQPWCFSTETQTSNTALAGHTFRCVHLAIGGVQSASCWICGPLPMVA